MTDHRNLPHKPTAAMKSIRVRLTAVVLGMLFIWISVDTILNTRVIKDAFRVHQQEDIRSIGYAVEAGLRAAMNSGQKEFLRQTLEALTQRPELTRVRVIKEDRKVVSSSDADDSGWLATDPPAEVFGANATHIGGIREMLKGQQVTTSYTPVKFTKDCMRCHASMPPVHAAIELSMSFNASDEALHRVQNTLLISTLTVFLMAGVVLWITTGFLISKPTHELEKLMQRVEGGDLSVRARPGHDEIGRLAHRFNYMVTELQGTRDKLQQTHAEQLERADRLATVGELAAGVAHEIKNPLAGISGAIEVIASELPSDDPHAEIFAEVLVQIRRVDKTLRDMLNFARPAEPRMVLTDLNELVRNHIPLFSRGPEHSAVSQEIDLADSLPGLNLDPDQIGQILVNLSLNARQAAAPEGTVAIRTYLDNGDGTVVLEVEDSGPGIPPDIANDIFKPFFTTKSKGTGLGLAICRRIARAHDGDLILAPVGKLGGARFVVKIPLPGAV